MIPDHEGFEIISKWIVNPLLAWGRGYIRQENIKDLIKVVKDLQKDFHRVVSTTNSELRVSTDTERQDRQKQLEEERGQNEE
jgi:hypothetical protein